VDKPLAVANYRTRLEAEVAAGFLDNARIPYVIQSAEGMLHGPLGAGATILVNPDHVEEARQILIGDLDPGDQRPPPEAVRLGIFHEGPEFERAVTILDREQIPYLATPGQSGTRLYVRAEHAERARRLVLLSEESA